MQGLPVDQSLCFTAGLALEDNPAACWL